MKGEGRRGKKRQEMCTWELLFGELKGMRESPFTSRVVRTTQHCHSPTAVHTHHIRSLQYSSLYLAFYMQIFSTDWQFQVTMYAEVFLKGKYKIRCLAS